MDRSIISSGQGPTTYEPLRGYQMAMDAFGALFSSVYGQTCWDGLGVVASNTTSSATAAITVASGMMVSLNPFEATAYGSLPADTSRNIYKMGINTGATVVGVPGPTSGSSVYAIVARVLEADTDNASVAFYSATAPGTVKTQNRRRAQTVAITATAIYAGSTPSAAVIPAPATGTAYLAIVTVSSAGAVSIASYSGTPPLASPLPVLKAQIAAEISRAEAVEQSIQASVAAEIGRAEGVEQSIESSISAETTRAEGVEQSIQTVLSLIEAGVVPVLWGPGATYETVIPANMTRFGGIFTAGGGGGSNCQSTSTSPSTSNNYSGGGGGAGATAILYIKVAAGDKIDVTVGNGGANQSAGSATTVSKNGTVILTVPGGAGSYFSAAGGSPGAPGGATPTYSGTDTPLFFLPLQGGWGSDGQSGTLAGFGNGGRSYWGGGGRAGNEAGKGGTSWGSAGGGSYDALGNNVLYTGGSGMGGVAMARVSP